MEIAFIARQKAHNHLLKKESNQRERSIKASASSSDDDASAFVDVGAMYTFSPSTSCTTDNHENNKNIE